MGLKPGLGLMNSKWSLSLGLMDFKAVVQAGAKGREAEVRAVGPRDLELRC